MVTNEAETVAAGFRAPESGESPCDWILQVDDDLRQSVKLNHVGGFSELTGFEVAQARQSLSAAARSYSATGRWWRRTCFDDAGLFVDADLLPEGEAVTIEELILRSIGTLDPPVPEFQINPDGRQLVQFKTLFWIEPAYWDVDRTDTQTAGRVSSTVRLVPSRSVWSPGDGSFDVVCDGPGESWEMGEKGETFPCGHTYRTVAGQPFTLTATVDFDIEVTATIGGAPAPGNLGPYEYVERTADLEVGTYEIQVVESNG